MNLKQWLIISEQLLEIKTPEEFHLTLVFVLQKLTQCQMCFSYTKTVQGFKLTHASHVSEIDRQAPLVEWLEKDYIPSLKPQFSCGESTTIEALPSCNHVIHFPIEEQGSITWGVVCLSSNSISEGEQQFLLMINNYINSLYKAMFRRKFSQQLKQFDRKNAVWICVAILLLGFIRLPQTVLAEAEVMPIKPELIAPSIEGVVKKIHVLPNEQVTAGQKLLELDDIVVKNKLEEATQKLNTANQRYLKAYRSAYKDTKVKDELSILENEVKQAEIEKKYYTNLLERTVISASIDGIALYSSPSDFIGKPVKVGEKVMLVADPKQKKINFTIPVDSVTEIDPKKSLVLYPNLHPLSTVSAKLKYINPIAESKSDGSLGFTGEASITDGDIALGEHGTLKLYGPAKSIWVLLFQRPLRFIRQSLGV